MDAVICQFGYTSSLNEEEIMIRDDVGIAERCSFRITASRGVIREVDDDGFRPARDLLHQAIGIHRK